MVRVCTVGAGWVVDSFLEGMKQAAPDMVHSAVYSFSEAEAKMFSEKHGITTVFTDLEKLAKSDEVDAVYIANPNALHYQTAKILLENGKHVLCEKTCVVTSEQLKILYEIADKNNVIFMEAMKGIYMPEIQVINEAMKKLGDIHMVKLDFCRYSSKYPEYREGGTPNIFNPKMAAGGLMDMGIYLVYPAIYWFGVPSKIAADAAILRTGADACGTVLFHSAGNVHITMSYGKASTSHHENLIMGDLGVIHMDSVERFDNCYIEYFDGKKEHLITRDLSVNPWGPETKQFYDFITDPSTAERYAQSKVLTTQVIAAVEEIRDQADIKFPEECYKA